MDVASRHRQYGLDVLEGLGVRQFGEHGLQIFIRFDAIRLDRFDRAIKVSADIRAYDCVAERKVFADDDERPDRVFNQIVVQADDEFWTLFVGVVHGFAERRACRHDGDMLIRPGSEILQKGF